MGARLLMYQNYHEIKRAKRLCETLSQELNAQFATHTTYQEKLPDGSHRRPVMILRNQAELDAVIKVRDEIAGIRQGILDATGSTARFTEPRIVENVLAYKVWVNTERSSSFSKTSRLEIIHNIKLRLERTQRLMDDDIAQITEILLRKELKFFENETEEFYRARTIGMPSSYAECHLANFGQERIKISESGLFIVGVNFDAPRGDFPTGRKPRKARATVYDGLEQIQYSGAVSSILYRESEVIAAKHKAGFDDDAQEQVIESRKEISRRRPSAPPEHPVDNSGL